MIFTRRDFGKIALASAAVPALLGKPNSKINGVQLGAQSYSFRDRPLDEAIKGLVNVGLSEVELWQGHIEPPKGTSEADIKKWRTSPETLKQMKEVKKKFDDAGIKIYAVNISFNGKYTDDEIDNGMEMVKTLGTKYITASSKVSQATRINGFAKKHDVIVAMHGHDNTKDPDEYSTPETFEKAMAGNSNIKINLDIGHFTAAGYDPVDYLKKMHKDIVTLHIKDRKKNHGANMPFGEGETPIKEVLQLLKTNKWAIPANIEYEYKGADTLAEVKKCYAYCKQALA